MRRSRSALFLVAVIGVQVALSVPRALPALGQTTTVQGIEVVRNVPFASPQGQLLTMDVFLPPTKGIHPGLMLVHGGGFHRGDKKSMQPVALYFAQNGYVAFTIEYRLAPRFAFPAPLEDATLAIKFMRRHAGQYGLDPKRIGALGGSAGATIVAELGTTDRRGSSGGRVAAVATWSGIMDMFRFTQERPAYVDVVSNYVYGASGGPLTQDAPQLRASSAVAQASTGDPPMFIANSRDEIIPYDQAQEMVATLKGANVPVEMFTPSGGHSIAYRDEADHPALLFLNHWVRDYAPSPTAPPSTAPTGSASGTGAVGTPSPSSSDRGFALVGVMLMVGAGLVAVAIVALLLRSRRRVR